MGDTPAAAVGTHPVFVASPDPCSDVVFLARDFIGALGPAQTLGFA